MKSRVKKSLFSLLIFAIVAVAIYFGGMYLYNHLFGDEEPFVPTIGGEPHQQNIYNLNQENTYNTLNTMDSPNILVIPVSFDDYSQYSTKENLNKIKKTFFVEDQNNEESYINNDATSWFSVDQYYYLSSYGNLKLKGKVTDWFYPGITTDELIDYRTTNEDYKYSGENGTWWLLNKAVEWYEKNNDDENEFDTDDDTYYDLVWLVYNAPYSTSENDLHSTFWAFTFWNIDNYGKSSKMNRMPYLYCFASLHFMFEGYGKLGLDSHTFVHETGHALGLNDYYSLNVTSKGDPDSYPYAGVDMMDFNIGDHCSYSKYRMGWVSPKEVISEPGEYKLNSSNNTGEFFVVSKNFAGHPFDEYFTIEYITPSGLNKKDYTAPYKGNGLQGYSKPGIRISHVDARGIKLNYKGEIDRYTTKYNEIDIVTIDNSPSDRFYYNEETKKYCQEIVIMQKDITGNYNSVLSSTYPIGRADPLFYAGEAFTLNGNSIYTKLMPSLSNKMNNGTLFDLTIEVKSLGDEATIVVK